MSILKDAMQVLIDLTKKSEAPQKLDIDRYTHGYVVNGELKVLDKYYDLKAKVETVNCLAAAVGRYADNATIFVGEIGKTVVAQVDEGDPNRCIYMPLTKSKALTLAEDLDEITQRELIKLLRGPLFGCIEESFLKIIRRLSVVKKSSLQSNKGHATDTFGRSVDAEAVSAEGDIPEMVLVTVPVFDNVGVADLSASFRCAVTVDPVSEQCSLVPVGDELKRELDMARQVVVHSIKKAMPNATVVVGSP